MQIDGFFSYLVRCVLLVYTVCVIAALIFLDHRIILAVGLSIGTGLGILKFKALVTIVKQLLPESGAGSANTSILSNLLSYLLIFATLVATAVYSDWLFAGTIAGLLILPLVLTLYCFGKGFGLIRR
jgi:hypothetical protein